MQNKRAWTHDGGEQPRGQEKQNNNHNLEAWGKDLQTQQREGAANLIYQHNGQQWQDRVPSVVAGGQKTNRGATEPHEQLAHNPLARPDRREGADKQIDLRNKSRGGLPEIEAEEDGGAAVEHLQQLRGGADVADYRFQGVGLQRWRDQVRIHEIV